MQPEVLLLTVKSNCSHNIIPSKISWLATWRFMISYHLFMLDKMNRRIILKVNL